MLLASALVLLIHLFDERVACRGSLQRLTDTDRT